MPDDSDPRFPRFRWENRTVPADTPTPHVGPLAEDLEAVAPWLVEGEGEDLTEDLRDLIGWLWGEAQDAIGERAALAKEVSTLTPRLDALTTRLNALERRGPLP